MLKSWIIDLDVSNHISGNASLFSSILHPKIPHVITLDNGSKVTSQGVGQIFLSPSLNLKHMFLSLIAFLTKFP